MSFTSFGTVVARSCASGLALALVLMAGTAQAQDKAYVMKITTPTQNASPDTYARKFAAAIEKESGGRIKGEVYPASQLGSIPRQIEGTQFGAIQCAVIPPEFFVGVDERFEVLAAPGLVSSVGQAQRMAVDPQVQKLMLGLGADKGLRGVGLLLGEPNQIVAKTAIRHLDDLKGKKIRIFASDFQSATFKRLGATPVAMSLGDVLPAIQQGAIDGAIGGIEAFNGLHFFDTAKYITMTNHAAIFLVVEVSRKWYDSLPADLQQIVDRTAASIAATIDPELNELEQKASTSWSDHGGELIKLPADEEAEMLKILGSVGADVAKMKPDVQAAYEIVTAAAQRAK
jgi:TRAP-type C4-dicarboxylate transport system substrate-binding protein